MIHTGYKAIIGIAPISANGAATSTVVDTLGFDYLEFWFQIGTIAADMTVLKLAEADAKTNGTTLTSGADITGTIYGTSLTDAGAASALPTTASDAGHYFKFEVDLRGRKRYIQLQATTGGATLISAMAILSRASQVPVLAADKGATAVLRV